MCRICDRIEATRRGENPYFAAELETGYAVIGDKQYFPGYTLYLCKWHETELYHLTRERREKFLWEMSVVAEAAARAFGAEKMNYELLGNGDAHLHWHLYPRRCGDLGPYAVNGGGPVWWMPWSIMNDERCRVTGEALEEMKAKLRRELEGMGVLRG